jgi:hypothetical protein
MVDPVDPLVEWARKREAQFAKSEAKEGLLRDRVLSEVYGGLWHTTHPGRFKGILASGAILPEPGIRIVNVGERLKALNTILTSALSVASVSSTSISLNPRITRQDVLDPLGRILFRVTSPGSARSGLS